MTDSDLAVIILAAGQGTRMKSRLPKVLHPLAGKPMLGHVIDTVSALGPNRIVVVVGPDMEQVANAAQPHRTVVQQDRLGTGHAVACAKNALGDHVGDVLILYGDVPLITVQTLEAMRATRDCDTKMVGLTFRPSDPARYGRVISNGDHIERIVEYKDASAEERAIGLCNAGMVLGARDVLFDLIARLDNRNAQGEYYLTDVFASAYANGSPAAMVEGSAQEVLGVNDRKELAQAEKILQGRLRARAMADGVTFLDPDTVWLSSDTRFDGEAVVEPNVFFGPGVRVGRDALIRAFCHLEGTEIGTGARIGPFARLRPGSSLSQNVHIGNFVEIKNANMGEGAKANHLAYVGDADVGPKANLGAGTITCNYDGFAKHRTAIGAGAFIGSNTALVAPVSVGDGVIVGAGSTITENIPADDLALGRGRQTNLSGRAKLFREARPPKRAK
ncbi:MAG: bifunctional UDP-N-acetylglucosamine diphosphorylase/glucosamine-1-phosphate N-acetyltransferase GlmU [Pseudomonadota bacterium]